MNTNVDLHLVIAQFEGGLTSSRNGAGCECHTDTAAMVVDLACQFSHLCEWSACFCQASYNFLQQDSHSDATPPRGIEAILHRDVIVGHNTFYLDIFGLRQFRCHLKIQHVTWIVLDNLWHALAA